jgi:hypothetical protein
MRGNVDPVLPVVVEPAEVVEDAARHLVRSAVRMGDGFLVREQAFTTLAAALGELA